MTLPNNAPYASAKRALALLSLTAREELKSDKIIVSVVYPYITLTNFERNTIRDVQVPESELEPRGHFHPIQRNMSHRRFWKGLKVENQKFLPMNG